MKYIIGLVMFIMIAGLVTAADCGVTPCSCGDTVTADYTMASDLTGCAGDGLMIGADSITLDCAGFMIKGTDASNSKGISMEELDDITVTDCTVKDFSIGLYINASDAVITGSNMTDGDVGIELFNSEKSQITSTILEHNDDFGAKLTNSTENKFSNNKFVDNGVNAQEDALSLLNIWDVSLSGNSWDDFVSNDGYPYTYVISGAGDGVDNHPVWNFTIHAPELKLVASVTVNESKQVSIQLAATDADGDTLTYSSNAGKVINSTFSMNANTGLFQWTPTYNDAGVYHMVFNVTDGTFWTEKTSTITVVDINRDPRITSTPVTTAYKDTLYGYQVTAVDDDGDALTYTLNATNVNITMSTGGKISWTPGTSGRSEHIAVRVADGRGGMATQSYTLTVKEPTKLAIQKVNVKVDGKSHNDITDGDTIKKDALPESNVKVKVYVESLFNGDIDAEDIDIENILVTVTIAGIDDGDDLEEESNEFNLRPGKEKSVEFSFDLPLYIDEGTYDVDILVEGEDENNNDHEVVWQLQLNVEKDNHDLVIRDAKVSPNILTCSRTAELSFDVINLGQQDEDQIRVTVESADLELAFEEEDIELYSGDTKDDTTYSKSLTINAKDLDIGVYSISIKAYYDTTKSGDSETVQFQVAECTSTRPPTTPPPDEGDGEEGTDLQVEYIPITTPPATTAQPVDSGEGLNFGEGGLYIVLLIVLMVAVVAAIVMAFAALKK